VVTVTVLKQYKGTGTITDPASWEVIFVGATGPTGPGSTVAGPTGPTGPIGLTGPPPPVVSLTRAAWLALSPPDANTVYIITDEGGVLLSGAGTPASGLGFNGDFYLDSSAWTIYGPKTTGTWGSPTSIIGPTGSSGAGTGIVILEAGSTIDTDIGTLDFGAGFDLTESPENEVNIALDLTEYTGGALPVAGGGTGATSAGTALTALGAQPVDADLTTIAGLTATTDNIIQSVGSAWASRTPAQVKTALALNNVDNTSDAGKPVSTAQATADGLKADKTTTITGTAPITTSGTLGSSPTVAISDFTVSTKGAVPTPGGTSSGRFLMDDGTWTLPPATSSSASGVFPFMYSTTTTEPPTGSQIRGNNATFTSSTKLWIMETTTDGLDVTVGLNRIKAGFQVYVQDYTSASRYALFNVTADATDKGAYWEVTVALASSAGTVPAGKIALQTLSSAQASKIFSTTTTIPGIAPGSAGATTAFLRGDATWATLSTASDTATGVVELATAAEVATGTDTTRAVTPAGAAATYAPISQTINAQTGTTYTLVLGDAGKLVTLSNASAITLTVPTNASVAFPVGCSIDLIQLGAGQFTVTGAGPPTISKSMATAKSRVQYSVMTLIKTATDVWILTGDAAAS
jgi:hypothetical protein